MKPKTLFGKEVKAFAIEHDIALYEIAAGAGVSYATMRQCMFGSRPGLELIPKVREYMANYNSKERGEQNETV